MSLKEIKIKLSTGDSKLRKEKKNWCVGFFPPLNKVVQVLLSCVVKDPPQLPNDKPNSL